MLRVFCIYHRAKLRIVLTIIYSAFKLRINILFTQNYYEIMKKILFFMLLSIFSSNAFAGKGWTMLLESNTYRVIKYNDSRVAELNYNGKWKIRCLKGRKRGKVGRKYDTLKLASIAVQSNCDKY